MQRSTVEVKHEDNGIKYFSGRKERVCSFAGKECTFVGEAKFSEFDEGYGNPDRLKSLLALYEAAAILTRFTDLTGYNKIEYRLGSRAWSSRSSFFGEEEGGLVIATTVDGLFEKHHNKFIVGFFSDSKEFYLPLLDIRRYWVEHDPHKGSSDWCDREYLLQIHQPSVFDNLSLGPRLAYRTRRKLKDSRGVTADSGYNPRMEDEDTPAGKRLFTIDEILKEPDVHEAAKLIVSKSDTWNKKFLSVNRK